MEKKLLMVASNWQHIRHFHLPYLAEFRKQGYTVILACAGVPADSQCCDQALDVPFTKSMFSPRNLTAAGMLRQVIRREKIDLVIVHTSLGAFFTRLAVMGLRKRPRMVNVVHGYLFDERTPSLKRMLLLGAEKLTAHVTDLLLTMNRWDYDLAVREHLGKRIGFIPGMGVDFTRLDAANREMEPWMQKIPPTAFVVTFAGEFSARKNQKDLVEAVARLPEQVFLVLAGDGQMKDACRQLAEEKGVAGRVLFPGYVRNIAALYARSQVIASSSRIEGLPFNILEAMYMKKPVVATRVKGHTDLIEEGVTGYLYDTPEECASALGRMLADPERCREMGEEAGKRVRKYGLTQVMPGVMEAYMSALDRQKDGYDG